MVALECEVTRKARCRFSAGSLPAAGFRNWLLLTVMLLVWAWPFSQMPRMRAGLAAWAFSDGDHVAGDQQAVVDGAAAGVRLHADRGREQFGRRR